MNADRLESLHTAILDAREGYSKAIEKAEQPDVRSLFSDIDAAHASAHADIHKALESEGEDADDSGSFMGSVHKTVIAVRSAVTGIDRDALGGFIDGEKRILGLYDEAIGEGRSTRIAAMLEHHRAALDDLVGRMEAMRGAD